MTSERQQPPNCEANAFLVSPHGVKVHFKLVATADKLVGDVETLLQKLTAKGYEPDAMANGRGPGPKPAKQEPETTGDVCEVCGAREVVALSDRERPTDKSPYFRCLACDACAWESDGRPTSWRESTRKGSSRPRARYAGAGR